MTRFVPILIIGAVAAMAMPALAQQQQMAPQMPPNSYEWPACSADVRTDCMTADGRIIQSRNGPQQGAAALGNGDRNLERREPQAPPPQ